MVRAQRCSLGVLICLFCLQIPQSQGQECAVGNSLFLKQYNYPYPWWVVYPADVPGVANRALTLRSALVTSEEAFAEQVILGIARNQTQAIAKSIGASLPQTRDKPLLSASGKLNCVRNAQDLIVFLLLHASEVLWDVCGKNEMPSFKHKAA